MMRALASDTGNTRLTFGQGTLALFYKCVSKHAKHVLFISSLHRQFNHYATNRRMATEKLNQVIDLAMRPDSLQVPQAISAKLWEGTGLDQVLTETAIINAVSEQDVEALAKKVVGISPQWSRYGSDEEMVKDTAEWIRSQHMHFLEVA